MTKRITLALSFLLLGLLACMQSAPSSPAHLPTKAPKALELATATKAASSCTVNTHALNVRDCASFDCSIVGWLKDRQTVNAELSGSSSRWIYITRGQLKGFARADYLTCK